MKNLIFRKVTLPQRKRPVHLPSAEKLNRSVIQVVTVCTFQRQPLRSLEAAHRVLEEVWQDDLVYRVGRYVIMPGHIHLFCSPNSYPAEPLNRWVSYWKSRSALKLRLKNGDKVWQKNFWDRQLRSHESYSEKWLYIQNNPVRAGLVARAEEWPHQGEVYKLHWHD